jgi:DNA-binding response OmpR family regulator
MKILLLEDDVLLGESLQEYLEMEDLEVDWAQDGNAVLDLTFEGRYDLYVLDINVPEINGLELLRELREAGDQTPAIYISALSDIESITEGFEAGAVDYLKKPFDPEELVVRIRHRFVRSDDVQHYGDLTFDPATGIVTTPDESIHLGEVQKEMFGLLLARAGEVVRPDELFELMREPNYNSLRVTISKMKKRLGIDIQNVRGEGYRLAKVSGE